MSTVLSILFGQPRNGLNFSIREVHRPEFTELSKGMSTIIRGTLSRKGVTRVNATKEQVNAYIQIVKAIAETIKELGSVPSGHLYAMVMSKMDIHMYNNIITLLKKNGFITEEYHVLTWIGESRSK